MVGGILHGMHGRVVVVVVGGVWHCVLCTAQRRHPASGAQNDPALLPRLATSPPSAAPPPHHSSYFKRASGWRVAWRPRPRQPCTMHNGPRPRPPRRLPLLLESLELELVLYSAGELELGLGLGVAWWWWWWWCVCVCVWGGVR
jgi:hypothetical protein